LFKVCDSQARIAAEMRAIADWMKNGHNRVRTGIFDQTDSRGGLKRLFIKPD